jgi:ParB family chromosome partitioning protein
VAPAVAGLAERLSDVLETRVMVELGRRRGRLVVQFATIDDLERIVGQIAPAALRPAGDPSALDGGSPGDSASPDDEVTGW